MSNALSLVSLLVLSLACASAEAPSEIWSAAAVSVPSPRVPSPASSLAGDGSAHAHGSRDPGTPTHSPRVGPSSTESATRAHPARSGPMQALEQMVTAQALLVSLLLTPLSKDGAGETVARVDAPAPPTRAKAR